MGDWDPKRGLRLRVLLNPRALLRLARSRRTAGDVLWLWAALAGWAVAAAIGAGLGLGSVEPLLAADRVWWAAAFAAGTLLCAGLLVYVLVVAPLVWAVTGRGET